MSDTQKHTPGPWSYSGVTGDNYIMARDARHGQSTGRVIIAEIARHRYGSADRVPPDEIQDANLLLIAAAPDLLKALEGMLEWARRVHVVNPGMEVANACEAIRKATEL